MSGRHLLRPTHSRPAPRPASNHHRLALPSSPSSPTVPRHSARLSHIPSSGPLPSGPICSQGRTNFSFRLVRSSPQRHPQVTSATFYASRCLASSLMFSSSNSFQAITLARNFACFRTPCRKSLSPCDPVGLIIAYLSGARLFGLPWTSWAPPRPYLYLIGYFRPLSSLLRPPVCVTFLVPCILPDAEIAMAATFSPNPWCSMHSPHTAVHPRPSLIWALESPYAHSYAHHRQLDVSGNMV